MRLLSFVLLLMSPAAFADIYVVVGANSKLQSITKEQLGKLYLGNSRGMKKQRITILDRDGSLREEFFDQVTGLSISQVNAHWAKLKFSGRVRAPLVMKSDDQLVERLRVDKNALSYVTQKPVGSDIRVILTIKNDE
ncbi:conserved hypothetical protein [Vibrio nigripulchritudo SFn27]|uniref:Phosphate ABC transporter substrate-binding protein n=1 Tax=Vibrio nigripulchritudo TaxID=28173 RepID=U4JU02_9VIBR|nr:hypothetical protein [Vibrio nigripulchritudo]CCN83847.1 conserved hypothetical protein [Vibrio nigripulchritudo BLFn1]CCN91130.1 conserved hypothetical protein [Vibrio nigripulchritudo SFn27]CCN92667.1 conserved hypothetical protein [Vibrio nigripulchritudo ENn2]CCO43865.1 conserved hypothetical protein [Vibrio nigripulchritudo SFn135]CCO55531.1 conserved hypothetical protein [Vibrio nigripulchritudo Wn13]